MVVGLKSIHEEDKLCFVIKTASSILDFNQFICLVLIKLTCENTLSTLALECGRNSRENINFETVATAHALQCSCNYHCNDSAFTIPYSTKISRE